LSSTSTLTISWTASSDASITSYTVQAVPTTTGTTVTQNFSAPATTYTITGLTLGLSYNVSLSATNIAGTSNYTSAVAVITNLYNVSTGTKGLVGTSGMTITQSGYIDDSYSTVSGFPFNVRLYSTSVNSISIGSNGYIGFGGASGSISTSFPSGPGANPWLFIQANADSQMTFVYRIFGTNYARIRAEGNHPYTNSSIGSYYEVTFFRQVNSGDDIYIEIVIGPYATSDRLFGMTNGGQIFTNFNTITSFSTNSSYVLILNSDGTFKSITKNAYISSSYS
jgi:hypothetical protein